MKPYEHIARELCRVHYENKEPASRLQMTVDKCWTHWIQQATNLLEEMSRYNTDGELLPDYPEHFKDFITQTFEMSDIKTIVSHGADCGFQSITYTDECVEIYNKYESEIWEMLYEAMEEGGYSNIPGMISQFGRVDMADDPDTFKNLLVWFAVEYVCQEILNDIEESEES